MITFIVLASVAAYAVADLFTARYLYGRMRAHSIDKHGMEWFTDADRPFFIVAAFVFAVAWPLALLGMGLVRFMETTPVRSQYEIERERDAMERRIHDLERELKL